MRLYHLIFVFMVMGGSVTADTHHGKMTREEVARLTDKQIANYKGQFDEDLNKEVEKAMKERAKK